jgi:aldehyde dehydrogenase (NAD+)
MLPFGMKRKIIPNDSAVRVPAGAAWVGNAAGWVSAGPSLPQAGRGKSGYGREMGFAAMAEYTKQKSVRINVDAALPDWHAR